MAIKVGTHYVSEAAYAHAQKAVSQQRTNQDMISQLSDRFPNAKFSTNTQPFQMNGTNNIAVSPAILQQMTNSPEKRLEYEALIFDCNEIQQSFDKALPNGSKIAARGFIIDAQGNLSSWCVTKANGDTHNKSLVSLPKDDRSSWIEKMTESLKQAYLSPNNKTEWRA